MIEQTKTVAPPPQAPLPVAGPVPVRTEPKFTTVPSQHVVASADQDGNVRIVGSLFLNPHVVGALVGTKGFTCETKAIGEELQFVIKLGVTKSIHDVKPVTPPANTVAPALTPGEAKQKRDLEVGAKPDVVHPATPAPVIAPSKPGTQAPIPATPEKSK